MKRQHVGRQLRGRRFDASFLGAAALGVLISGTAHANSGIVTEAVQNYGCGTGACGSGSCGTNNLCNTFANAEGFSSTLFAAGLGFSEIANYKDGNVHDTDFVDPDLPNGSAHGNDTNIFDTNSSGHQEAIGFFAGHGWTPNGSGGCEDTSPNPAFCQHDSQCTNPNPTNFEQSTPAGSCVANPASGAGDAGYGLCCYPSLHRLIVHGSVAEYGDYVKYDEGYAAWGESIYSGGWADAGTNGQVNLVVLNASWPVTQNYGWTELGPAMAGARLIAATMPVRGDTSDVPDRGTAFATYARNDPTYAVFDAWMDAINTAGGGGGGYGCPAGNGFNGCGCHIVLAPGASETEANEHSGEDWNDLQSDATDATGNGWVTWGMICNYDLQTYPFNLP